MEDLRKAKAQKLSMTNTNKTSVSELDPEAVKIL